MKHLFAAAAFVWLSAASGHAQEVIGTIEAKLGDGERTWFITSESGESQSFFLDQGSIMSASLWGNPADDEVFIETDSLVLSFTVIMMGNTAQLADASVEWFSKSQREAHRSQPGGVNVVFETIEEDGDGFRVRGTFESSIAFSDDFGDTFDATTATPIAGAFDAVLPLE